MLAWFALRSEDDVETFKTVLKAYGTFEGWGLDKRTDIVEAYGEFETKKKMTAFTKKIKVFGSLMDFVT
jgi:cystathionine beta-lyase family protein involved in aluminum resistance